MTQSSQDKKLKRKKELRNMAKGWSMSMWPLIGFFLFGFIPLVLSAVLSFTDLKSYRLNELEFIGFENYKYLFNDADFGLAIKNTLFYSLSMPISLVLGLLIAMLLNKKLKGTKFYRSVFFIPYVCSVVAVATMWKWMFNTDYGIINNFIVKCGGNPVPWLTEAKYFRLSMLIILVWSNTGFNIILFQSALANINKSYYEAADIEGAGPFTKFFKLTLPAISPTTFYIVIMGLIGSLQVYTQMQVMANPPPFGPEKAGITIVFYLVYVMRDGLTSLGMGLAAAIAWILAIAIICITVLNFTLSKKWVHYD